MNAYPFTRAIRAVAPAAAGLLLALVVAALLAGPARAQPPVDRLGFQIQVPSGGLVVNEDAGQAVITVTRDPLESAFAAQIRYVTDGDGYNPATNAPFSCGAAPCTAVDPYDFASVKGELDFAARQTSASFSVPIVDHGTYSAAKTIRVSLFGPSPAPIGLGPVSSTTLTVLENDPDVPRNPQNPLGLTNPATGSDPLAGASLFVDPDSEAANAAKQHPALHVIASQPGTERFGSFSTGSPYVPDIGTAVSRYLARAAAEEPGTIPLLATYRIVDGIRGNGDSTAQEQAYFSWVTTFAQGIGSYPAVLFLEMDSLITAPGLNAHGLATRMAELEYAINVLTADCPHLVIYLDAGAADGLHARKAASLLLRAGVSKIQGFFLNSTHFDWTSKEIRYGEQISRLTGGKHFVINTGENGQGPLRSRNIVKQGIEVLNNPLGRGLGPKPTTHTGYPNVDMFAWTSNPGESGGTSDEWPGQSMRGAPPTGEYWPDYALMLVRNADFTAARTSQSRRRRRLVRPGPSPR